MLAESPIVRQVVVAALLMAVCAGAWFAWFAWDDESDFQAWQVISCGVTVIAAVVWSVRILHPVIAGPMAGIAFGSAWGWTSVPGDETGLTVVGLIMVLVGVTTGTVIVALASYVYWTDVREPRRAL